MASTSPNVRAVLSYVSALEEWDIEKIMAHFDEGLEHQILPTTLGRPIRNKTQYREWFVRLMPLFRKWRLNIHELVEAGDTIVFHASSEGETTTGAPYRNQYAVIMHLMPPSASSSGELPHIVHVKEFVDSLYTVQFFEEERERQAKIAQGHSE